MTRPLLLLLFASQASSLWAAPQIVATHTLRDGIGVSQPNSIAYDPLRNELWVAGVNGGNLVVVDVAAGKPVLSIEGLGTVQQLALDSGRDRVYALTNYRFVKALSASGRAPLKSIDVGYNRIVYGLAVDPVSGGLFTVENVYDPQKAAYRRQLCRYDAGTGVREASLDLGTPIISGKGWTPVLDGGRLFLGLSFSSGSVYSGEVWTLDAQSLAVLQKLPLGPASGPTSLALDPGDKTLFVGDLFSRLWVLKPAGAGQLAVVSSRTFSAPGALALDPGRRRLYAAVTYSNEVQVLDSQTLQTVATLGAGAGPSALALGPGRALGFAANTHSSDITVLDLAAEAAVGTISLRRDAPEDLAFDPGSAQAFITSGFSNGLITWDRAAAQETAFLPLSAADPGGVVLFRELDKAFIRVSGSLRVFNTRNGSLTWPSVNLGSIAELKARRSGGELLVLQTYAPSPDFQKAALSLVDARTGAPTKTVLLGPNSVYPKDVDDDPLTGKAYVTLYGANQVAVVDLASGVLLKTVPVGSYPWGVAVDHLRGRVYVSNYGSNSLSVIDAASDMVIATLAVGKSPKGVDFKQRGGRIYVVNSGQGTLSVIDSQTLQTAAVLPVGGFPRRVRVDQAAERAYVMGYSSASLTVVSDAAPAEAVSAPKVTHIPVTGPVPEDQPVTVRAEVTDDDAVAVVTLTYWEAGRGRFVTVPMQAAGGSAFEAKIPAEFLLDMQGAAVSYFIDATDAAGNGPPTGTAPGSAASPNTFAVRKSFTKLWSYTFGRIFGGPYRMIPGPSAAIGEIRADLPGLEIATGNEEYFPLGNPGPAGRWFVFRSNGTVLFWKDTENDEAHSSVNLFDLDADGRLEMLGGTTSGNQIQAFTGTGDWLWRHYLQSHAVSTPAVAVLAPGGAPRVFGGSFDTQFRAIEGKTGKLLWSYPAGDWIWSSGAVADLDGDGAAEVVFASDGEQSLRPGVLHCLDAATGKLRWKQTLSRFVRASAALADVDGDGIREVLIGSDDGVFRAFSGEDGALKWSFATGGEITASAAVGDLDGDGSLEIVFGSADGKVYALTGRGAVAWTRDLGAPVYSSPALARRQPGARLDVYAASWDGTLHILSGADGRRLGGTRVGPYLASSPSVADIDGDGKLEVVLQDREGDDNDNRGDVFWALRDQESSVAPYAREWPMFRGGPAHTGLYAGAAAPVPVQDLPPSKVLGLAVLAPPEGGRLALAWTANPEPDLAFYRVYRDGKFLTQVSTNAYSDAGLTDGTTYTYRVSAVDKAGQEGPLSDPASGLPLPPPSVKILKPADGATVAGFAAITAGVTGSVGSVAYTLDGVGYLSGVIITPPYTLYWDTTKHPNGKHLLKAGGWDKATGKWLVDSAAISVTIANPVPPPPIPLPAPVLEPGPPTVEILTPAYGSVISGSLTITAAITGNIGCVAYTLDGHGYLNACLMNAPYAFVWDTTKVAPGTHTLTAGGWDKTTGAFLVGSPPVVLGVAKPAPAKVSGLTVTAPPEGGRLALAWTANPEPDLAAYRVYRDGKFLTQVSTNAYADAGLTDGTTYTYRVSAVDKAGQEGPLSDAVTGTPKDLLKPLSRITAPKDGAVLTSTSINVAGTAADLGVAGVAKVELGVTDLKTGAQQWLPASGTTSFQLQLGGLIDGHAYALSSRASDQEGNVESALPVLKVSVDLGPAKVQGLAVLAQPEGGRLALAWTANTEPDLAAYRVYRDGKSLLQVVATSALDSGLSDGTSYSYRVSAVDQAGQEGPLSDAVTGTPKDSLKPVSRITAPEKDLVIGKDSLLVTGTAVDLGISGIESVSLLLRDLEAQTLTETLGQGTTGFQLVLAGLQAGHSYELGSRARDREGNVEASPVFVPFQFAAPPGAVRGLAAQAADNGLSALLTWTAPEASPYVTGYRIYAGQDQLASAATTQYQADDLTPGTSYSYSVGAVDQWGREGPRTAVQFTTPDPGKAAATIRNPKDGKKLWGNALTIMAEATEETVKVVFQSRWEAGGEWRTIAEDEKTPYAVYWNISDANVSTGPYLLRAVAYDGSGRADAAPATIRVILDDANADLVEDGNPEVDPNNEHRIQQKVSQDDTEVVATADGTQAVIPAGTVAQGERLHIRAVPPAEAPKPNAGQALLKPANVFREFSFASGLSRFDQNVELTLPVPDADRDGVVDGTDIPVPSLKAYYFDELRREWRPVTSTVRIGTDPTARTGAPRAAAQSSGALGASAAVLVSVDHFTLFGLFQEFPMQKTVGFGEVYAFPNPARPGQQPTLHIEAGAATQVKIRIYDVSGEFVHGAELSGPPQTIDDGQGPQQAFEYRWDVSGAGSGVYLYSVTVSQDGAGTATKVGKCSIIR